MWAGALVAVGLVAIILAVRASRAMKAEASAMYATAYPAANAIDGKPETEWLLPDRVPGWIDLRFPSRSVGVVRLLNAHNPPHGDRASQTFRITAFDGRARVKAVDGTFGPFDDDPEPLAVDVGVARCDRLQIEILTSHKSGGGLAEIEIP
jgi:hypothetical protein